jgi:hypothetical protein
MASERGISCETDAHEDTGARVLPKGVRNRTQRNDAGTACGYYRDRPDLLVQEFPVRRPAVRHSMKNATATPLSTTPHNTARSTYQLPVSIKSATKAPTMNSGPVRTQWRTQMDRGSRCADIWGRGASPTSWCARAPCMGTRCPAGSVRPSCCPARAVRRDRATPCPFHDRSTREDRLRVIHGSWSGGRFARWATAGIHGDPGRREKRSVDPRSRFPRFEIPAWH